MQNNLSEMFQIRRSANGGCRPGCGCLIVIILLILGAGWLFRTFLGGGLQINLPEILNRGGTTIEYPDDSQNGSRRSDDTFDYERDRNQGSQGTRTNQGNQNNQGTRNRGGQGSGIDYDNPLQRGLSEEDLKDMDI